MSSTSNLPTWGLDAAKQNYSEWNVRASGQLRSKKLWRFASTSLRDRRLDAGDDFDEFLDAEQDEQAMGFLTGTVTTGELVHLEGVTSTHQAWENLRLAHNSAGVFGAMYTWSDFISCRKSGGQSLQDYINEMQQLRNKLVTDDQEEIFVVNDRMYAYQLLIGVADESQEVVTAV